MFKTERLLSLEGVRAFAFIMVMLAHTGISVLPIRGLGGWSFTLLNTQWVLDGIQLLQ